MSNTTIPIITLTNQPANDDEYNKVVEFCRNLESVDVVEKTLKAEQIDCKPSELIPSPSDINVIILWCHDKIHRNLSELRSIIDIAKRIETDKSLHAGCIIVLDHSTSNILDEDEQNESIQKIKDELLGKSYLLARPISLLLLRLQIESIVAKIKNKQLLNNFKSDLLKQQNIVDILTITLDTLHSHPGIGYHRATISLVTQDKNMTRFLLKHHDTRRKDSYKPIRRDLQKPISEDKLMKRVCEKNTFIISNLYNMRKTPAGSKLLEEWGWEENNYSTQEVNSWIGLAAKHEGETIAVFMLDSDNPDNYDFTDERLYEYLESFGQAFADRIYSYFVRRNNAILRNIMASIGDKLDYVDLINTIIATLRDEFQCEECAYFDIVNEVQDDFINYNVTSSCRYPRKLRVAKKDGPPVAGKSRTRFRQGKGIIGKVWNEKKPHIVANAQEDDAFIESPTLKSFELSMLVVPVLATSKPNEERIIGIICCHQQSHPDFFTTYDQLLVQNVAVATANIIERTRILESLSDIALKTADMSVDEKTLKFLLQTICQSAYALTSVNSASIHLLEGPFDDNYRKSLKPNFSYPVNHEDPPRLEGTGVTDCVIKEMQTKEFSMRLENYNFINPKYRDLGIQCKLVVPLTLQDGSDNDANEPPKRLLGCLYLDKYQENSFSDVEIFTLELLARHAAISLNKNLMLAEKTISTKSLEGLKNAIDSIAGLEELNSLLQEVAWLAYELCGLPKVTVNQHQVSSEAKSVLHTSVWPDLIAYVAEYSEQDDILRVRAAYPPHYLGTLDKEFLQGKDNGKVGISGLAIGLGTDEPTTININDIDKLKEDINPLLARHYIKINVRTRSQLSVPILGKSLDDKGPRKLGVITLEHTTGYAFSNDYVNVIKQFAQHVAIAYGRQISKEEIEHKRQVVTSLHNSLGVIVREPSQSMLYKAVTQTREALRANAVYVVPIQYEKPGWIKNIGVQGELKLQMDKCVPAVDDIIKRGSYRIASKLSHASDHISENTTEFSFEDVTKQVFEEQRYKIVESRFGYGYCFPFSSADERIGVVWILLGRSSSTPKRSFDEEVISSYVNTIALSYANSTQFHDLITRSQNDLDQQMKKDNANVRRQSNHYFLLAFFTSWTGIIMLMLGIFLLYSDGNGNFGAKKWNAISLGALGTGLALEVCTILVFRQLEAANRRLDQYHRESLSIGQLNILLSASNQVSEADSLKSSLIEGAKAKWLAGSEVGKAEPGESAKSKWFAGPERGKVE
jgi:GAF domain-containing protein